MTETATQWPVPLVAALSLCLVHMFAAKLRFFEGIPRSIWLSGAGGVSVSYAFLHILPDLSEAQESVKRAIGQGLGLTDHHVYVVALLGLSVFYGLERAARQSRQNNKKETGQDSTTPGVFWLHIGSFSLYNALIGYLLMHRQEQDFSSLLMFAFAMAVHFIVSDFSLHEHHKNDYAHFGRWILSGAVLGGWGIGRLVQINDAAVAVLFAFLAGGIVLNVLKEELPEERESRFWAFAAGAGGYAALLLAL